MSDSGSVSSPLRDWVRTGFSGIIFFEHEKKEVRNMRNIKFFSIGIG
jgi:hypothetical protein